MVTSLGLFAEEINPADQMDSMIHIAFATIIVIIAMVIYGNYKYQRSNIGYSKGTLSSKNSGDAMVQKVSMAIFTSILLLLFTLYLIVDMGWGVISVWAILSLFILQILYSTLTSAKELVKSNSSTAKTIFSKSRLFNLIVFTVLLLGVIIYLIHDDLYALTATLLVPLIILHQLITSYFKYSSVESSCDTKESLVQQINEEEDVLLDHDYDGIKELDNNLPSWWLYGFYGCIAFALIYLYDYHIAANSPLQVEEYEIEIRDANNEIEVNTVPVQIVKLEDDESMKNGAQIYRNNCMACHLEDGGGSIGPNLTDEYWIHGGDFESVVKVINDGVLDKGMIAWKSVLNPTQINEVSSYLLSLPKVEGKAPQGEVYIEKQ